MKKKKNSYIGASSLRALNLSLTELMAKQQIQVILKDSSELERLIEHIDQFRNQGGAEENLLAAAILGRLLAVARGKQEENAILKSANEILRAEPPPLDVLVGADEKLYATRAIAATRPSWAGKYAARETILIDSAELARRALTDILVNENATISDALSLIANSLDQLSTIESADSRARRAKRISVALSESVQIASQPPGHTVGAAIELLAYSIIPAAKEQVPDDIIFPIVDDVLRILNRCFERRFSLALEDRSYAVLRTFRSRIGRDSWDRFIRSSNNIRQTAECINEAASVLARQNRTDQGLFDAMLTLYQDRQSLARTLDQHMTASMAIEPTVRNWWLSGGANRAENSEFSSPAINSSEDQRIGEALIEVEKLEGTVTYLSRTVRPEIQFAHMQASSAIGKLATSHKSLSQHLRFLARMRGLALTSIEGTIIEYNAAIHDMVGGHQAGVRRAKVVREGVQKQYGSRTAILVRPRVEPADDQTG